MPELFEREMGLTHAEFFRTLPSAVGLHPYEVAGQQVRVKLPDGELSISLGKEQVRKIASITLPYTCISFRFSGVNDEERTKFLKYFDSRYQRGGG